MPARCSGDFHYVRDELAALVRAVRVKSVNMGKGIVLLKVMLHAGYLDDKLKKLACKIVEDAGADFVETSTGHGDGVATIHDVGLLRHPARGDRCQGFRRHRFRRGRGGRDRGRRGEDRHRARGRDHGRLLEVATGLVTPHDDARERWPERRFSQAISEGDGISVIPFVRGGGEVFAGLAEAAGAEGLAVETIEQVAALRQAAVPALLQRRSRARRVAAAARSAGVDACVFVHESLSAEGALLEELVAGELGIDWALERRGGARGGARVARSRHRGAVRARPGEATKRVRGHLDLLPDVPAGKLVVSDSRVTTREQVLGSSRAGVDAVLVPMASQDDRFSTALAQLTGRV